jgi:hypothetical protein
MPGEPRIVVSVAADGTVSAHTEGLTGAACLDYIAVLEDLLQAQTVHSAYTAEYQKATTEAVTQQEVRDVDHA